MTLKNDVFCDVNAMWVLLEPTRGFVDTGNAVPSSLIHSTLILEAIFSSETSVLTRATLQHIPEDDIIHSHRRENLKSYTL
jgi:hypothetical protein